MNLLGNTPGNEPKPKGKVAYGFYPMVELRRDTPRPGRLVQVDDKGEVLGDWPVTDNEPVVQYLSGKLVILPPGFDKMAKRLRAVKATVWVHHRSVDAPELAAQAFSDVIWV